MIDEKIPAQEKTLSEMTPNDLRAIGQQLRWRDRNLLECSKLQLIEAVLHLTRQVALLQNQIAKEKIVHL